MRRCWSRWFCSIATCSCLIRCRILTNGIMDVGPLLRADWTDLRPGDATIRVEHEKSPARLSPLPLDPPGLATRCTSLTVSAHISQSPRTERIAVGTTYVPPFRAHSCLLCSPPRLVQMSYLDKLAIRGMYADILSRASQVKAEELTRTPHLLQSFIRRPRIPSHRVLLSPHYHHWHERIWQDREYTSSERGGDQG